MWSVLAAALVLSVDLSTVALSAKVDASIGVAFSGPDTDLDGLIRRADLAMYTAKRGGRGISVFYDPALEAGQPEADQPEADPAPAATSG